MPTFPGDEYGLTLRRVTPKEVAVQTEQESHERKMEKIRHAVWIALFVSLSWPANALDCSAFRAQCPDNYNKCTNGVSDDHDACDKRCNARGDRRDSCLKFCQDIADRHQKDVCDSVYDNCMNGPNPLEDLCGKAQQDSDKIHQFGR